MKYSVVLYGKSLQVEISRRAEKALNNRDKPVIADVHLIFGCMLAKRIWFKDQVEGATVAVCHNLEITFQTVKYEVCSFENIDHGGVPTPFAPSIDMNKFIPSYVLIDYVKGEFCGQFAYARGVSDHGNPA
ncbi:MAG TPA: hypothetical protein VIN38_13205 [Thiobacillus sp.]